MDNKEFRNYKVTLPKLSECSDAEIKVYLLCCYLYLKDKTYMEMHHIVACLGDGNWDEVVMSLVLKDMLYYPHVDRFLLPRFV